MVHAGITFFFLNATKPLFILIWHTNSQFYICIFDIWCHMHFCVVCILEHPIFGCFKKFLNAIVEQTCKASCHTHLPHCRQAHWMPYRIAVPWKHGQAKDRFNHYHGKTNTLQIRHIKRSYVSVACTSAFHYTYQTFDLIWQEYINSYQKKKATHAETSHLLNCM